MCIDHDPTLKHFQLYEATLQIYIRNIFILNHSLIKTQSEMTLIKTFLLIFWLTISVNAKPSLDENESESQNFQFVKNLRQLKETYERNKSEIHEQMKVIELETWKYNETFKNVEKTLETKASELKQKELNEKRKILQTEFEKLVNEIDENVKKLFEASKDLDKEKSNCVWENVDEEECSGKVNEQQRKIESLNQGLKIFIEKLAENQKEIENHEKLRQKSVDEFLKFTKDLLESERESVEKVKKLEENYIQKQHELQALEQNYERMQNEMKNGEANVQNLT